MDGHLHRRKREALSTAKVKDGRGKSAERSQQGRATTSQCRVRRSVKTISPVNATWKEKPKTLQHRHLKSERTSTAKMCITSSQLDDKRLRLSEAPRIRHPQQRQPAGHTSPSPRDSYLEISRASFISSRRRSAKRRHRQPGTYKVGFDIPAAPYKLTHLGLAHGILRDLSTTAGESAHHDFETTFKSPTASIFCSVGAQARLITCQQSHEKGSLAAKPSPKPERQGFKPARKKVVQRWHDLRSSLNEDSARAKRGSGLSSPRPWSPPPGDARSRDVLGKHVAPRERASSP